MVLETASTRAMLVVIQQLIRPLVGGGIYGLSEGGNKLLASILKRRVESD